MPSRMSTRSTSFSRVSYAVPSLSEYASLRFLKRVASLASMASGAPSSRVVAILERLVSDTSPVIDESVQLGAVECLHVLVRAFPGTASTSALILRSFILSPCPIFEVTGELSASPALRAAASAFAACTRVSRIVERGNLLTRVQFANDGNTASSVIQSLVSHLIVSDREGTIRASQNASIDARSIRSGGARSDSQQRLISANVAHAVAIIALEVDQAAVRPFDAPSRALTVVDH